jgi:hypothetical protein
MRTRTLLLPHFLRPQLIKWIATLAELTQQLFQGRGASANSVSFSLWVRRTGTNNFVYILSKRELVGVLYAPGGGEGGRDVVGDRHQEACPSVRVRVSCVVSCAVFCVDLISLARGL